MNRTVLVILALATAHASRAEDGRALLDHFLNDVTTLAARFDQSLVDADGILVEESSGSMEIQRPGRFRWAYDEPYEQLMIADGLNVWSYDVDLEQVTVKPQQEVLGNTPALLLGGSADVLEDFRIVESTTDRSTTWVTLEPLSDGNGFTKLELGFDDGNLRRMIFTDNLQQSTLIVLYDLEINQPIESANFEFSPPPGVDLVGVPLVADAGTGAATE